MDYVALKHDATILPDYGGYELSCGEMNPAIFAMMLTMPMFPPVIWEPFAGCDGKTHNMASEAGIAVIAHTLGCRDCRTRIADSTKEGPGQQIGGMLFHPTYFGAREIGGADCGIAAMRDEKTYLDGLSSVAHLASGCMEDGAIVCAVGRDYRIGGKRIRLDYWYQEVFGSGFDLVDVWLSEPDVVLVFRRKQ